MPNKPIRRKYRMFIDEEDMESGVYAISLVENPAIEENWIYLSKQHKIELAEANGEKRLLIGPVLIPNKEIPRIDNETGEEYDIVFDEKVIEKAAQLFLQRQHNNDSTLEHTENVDDVSIVESWIIADSKADKSNAYNLSYPKGTWMVMAKVNNDEIWSDYVKTGKVKGFSLEGLFGHNLVEASKQLTETALSALLTSFDNEYAEEILASIKGIIKKDGRMKDGKYLELETYNDYPDTVKNAAQRGIDLNAKVGNKCATDVGKIRAQQLANGRNISVQTIKRMYAYTSRAREFYNPDDTTACGTISYLLWGGDAANRWSAAKLKELGLFEGSKVEPGSIDLADYPFDKCLEDRAKDGYSEDAAKRICGYIRWYVASADQLTLEELETATSIASSYAGQFGPAKDKKKANLETQYIAGPTSAKDKKRFPGNRGTMFYPYIAPAMLQECPPATQDIELNLKNRQTAIDQANYGPLNPNEPNEEYWQRKADQFGGDVEAAKKARCGNCAFFDVRQQTLACIAEGIGQEDDPELVIEAGQLGYCEAFDFKCAAKRTCDAWVVGGPITDEIELAEVGPKGGIKSSPKAPKSDTPNPSPKGQGTAGGSAAGKRGAEVSREDEKTLADKADEFNKRESNTKYGKAGLGALKSVFQRGLGAYNTSRSPEVARAGGAKQWALARVNAFLYLLKNGRPQNRAYTQDNDLLPKGHPKSE